MPYEEHDKGSDRSQEFGEGPYGKWNQRRYQERVLELELLVQEMVSALARFE